MRPILAPEAAGGVRPLASPPSFSVVIPVYQLAALAKEAVASALDQTTTPLEVIVCDDGSTDDLAAVLRPYEERITLLRQRHAGPGAARNTAVAAAQGEFVCFLDADDLYLPERIEALGELGKTRPDLDVLGTDGYLVRDGQVFARFNELNPFPVERQRIEIHDRCFLCAPAVRRSRLLRIGGFDSTIPTGQDWDCWIRLILDGASAGLVNEPHFHYRLRPGSVSSDRARSSRQRVRIVSRTLAHPTLAPHEATAVRRLVQAYERDAALAEMEAALQNRDGDRRGRAFRIATSSAFDRRTRVKAALAAAAPSVAARFLERRQRHGGDSRLSKWFAP